MLSGWWRRQHRAAEGPELGGDGDAPLAPGTVVVDPATRTYWSRGQAAAETLVEARGEGAEVAPLSRRLAAAVAERERQSAPRRRRPVVDPCFAEALFVELLRERRYERAFGLLAPECQRAWGSVEAFAAAHGEGGEVVGVSVRAVRLLSEWRDGDRVYHDVAEVDATYAVRLADGTAVVERTVHLVALEGRWRSLCWPSGERRRRRAAAS